MLFFLVFMMACLSGCDMEHMDTHQQKQKARIESEVDSLRAIDFYKGMIPSKGFDGIVQQLWLLKGKNKGTNGMFLLRETYILRDTTEQIINSRGEWEMVVKEIDQSMKPVLVLHCDQNLSCGTKYYEVKEEQLLLLNSEGQRIKSKLNYLLERM